MKTYIFVLFLSVLTLFVFVPSAFAKSETGTTRSATHRSVVSAAVEKLREVAGKDRNIGEEVRVIAQEQEDANAESTMAMEAVELRSALRTFLLGTDYKNLGVLRSTLVTTENHISRLNRAVERAADPAVKIDLNAQISALQEEHMKVETFIKDNESKFSLFGWLARLFAR